MLWGKVWLFSLAAVWTSHGQFLQQIISDRLENTLGFQCKPPTVNLEEVLPQAAVDWGSLTVSGASSGAIMAAQYHFAHSAEVIGAGILAGVPYGQFYLNHSIVPAGALRFFTGPIPLAPLPWLTRLPLPIPFLPSLDTVSTLKARAEYFADRGLIDPTSNIYGSRVYVHSGTQDKVVNNVYGHRGAELYNLFGANVKANLHRFIDHVLSTDNWPLPYSLLGVDCQFPNLLADAVVNCGFEIIFDMFRHIYGPTYVPPASSSEKPTGSFRAFYQTNLTASGNATVDFMDDVGYLYVPARCQEAWNTCKIHIALHGCVQSIYNQAICNFFALGTGYLQVADSNDVVMVFPQSSGVQFDINAANITSNVACWDFFAGVDQEFLFKSGRQLASIRIIAAKVAGVL